MARLGVRALLENPSEGHPPDHPSSNASILDEQEDSNELSENGSEDSYDPNKFEPDCGECTNCNGPGTIGESCPDCEEEGGVYLNLQARL
jgi:hypothetical protein